MGTVHAPTAAALRPALYRRRVAADYFARESSANRYCPSSARYRRLAAELIPSSLFPKIALYRRLVRRTYSIFPLPYSLNLPGIVTAVEKSPG